MGHYSRGCTNEKPAEEEEEISDYPSANPIPAADGPSWGGGSAEVVLDDGW